jgi:streptogramin lyase
MTEFPTTFGQNPAQITVGPDGNLWVSAGSKVAKIT